MHRRPRHPKPETPALPLLALALFTPACGHRAAQDAPADATPRADGAAVDGAARDAGSGEDEDDASAQDASAARNFTPPTQIVALGTWVPVRRAPERHAQLAGYLRAGAITRVVGMPHGTETCPVQARFRTIGGWYELAGGGYVCVGNRLTVPYPSRDQRPVQPAFDAGGMPYTYAIVTSNTIMYREPPTEDQLRVYERWRFRRDAGPTVAASAMTPTVAAGANAAGDPAAAGAHAAGESGSAAADPAGGGPAQAETPTPAPAAPRNADSDREHARDHDRDRDRDRDREHDHDRDRDRADRDDDHEHHHHRSHDREDEENPPLPDLGATPTGEIRLRDLSGSHGGPVVRRLLAGMFVALDRTVRAHDSRDRYWHTQSGGWVRTSGLDEKTYRAEFTGVRLDESHSLPYAFMLSRNGWVFRLTPNNHGAIADHRIAWRTGVYLTNDPPLQIGSGTYYRTTDGFAVNDNNVRVIPLRTPPEGSAADERWIDVDLDEQTLAAYEGTRPVYVTLISSGRGPEPEMLTPEGHFRIHGKHITTTMDGDVSGRGPYSIEDVPWTMYFHDTIALHGAFWHQMFGYRMSHGCVNLSPPDAQWIFFWSEPQLPEGWHGIFASDERPGTRVEVHHGERPVVQGRLRP